MVTIGKNKKYYEGDYVLEWLYGTDFKRTGDHSMLTIRTLKKELLALNISETSTGITDQNLSLLEANEVIDKFGFELDLKKVDILGELREVLGELLGKPVTSVEPLKGPTEASELPDYVTDKDLGKTLDKEIDKGTKYDDGKIDWTLLPFDAVQEVVEVLKFGEKKYGRDNWQGVSKPRYISAAFRHLIAYTMGEKLDTESGKSHLAHAMCCLIFSLWHQQQEDK